MFKSQILKIYRKCGEEKAVVGKRYKKEQSEFERLEKAVSERIGDDKEFKSLMMQLLNATDDLNYADIEDVFKEGFIFGARLMLELYGVECDEE